MASNRSNVTSRSATEPAGSPGDALANVARHTARIQIAALGAAGKAIAGWVHAADLFAEAIGDELLRRVEGETGSGELIACVASATNVHLRELTTLPGVFSEHFDARLSRTSTDTRRFS
jgi:hypothetical protein